MDSKSTILDSSVWVALFSQYDSQHTKAWKILKGVRSRIVIPEYIILEVVTVLAQRASKKCADMFLERMCDNSDIDILHVEENHFYSFCEAYRQLPDGKLSFIDCALACLAKEYEIITFDTHLKKSLSKMR